MPTLIVAEPKAPHVDRTVDEAIMFGRQQWGIVWRAWARQWSQPGLIKLAAHTLRVRAVHSSQIHGFASGALRDPSPKLLLSVGELNLAIARSNGVEGLPAGPLCPGTLENLWKGYQWLRTPEGRPMGPLDVFAAVSGYVDLQVDASRVIPYGASKTVAAALGKYLRLHLGSSGIDWMGDDQQSLRAASPELVDLLLGKEIAGDQIVLALEEIALASGTDEGMLWQSVIVPAIEAS